MLAIAVAALVAAATTITTAAISPGKANAAPTTAKIDFQPAASATPTGYTADTGKPYDSARGYGWLNAASNSPADMSTYARARTTVAGPNATFIHMQPKDFSATATPATAYWQYCSLPVGVYDVSVGVGDADYTDSSHAISIEGAPVITKFVPTPTDKFRTGLTTVTVNDGCLTVRPNDGRNTKIDWITIAPTSKTIISTDPVDGATNVNLTASVTFQLSQPVRLNSINSFNMKLYAPDGSTVPAAYASDGASSLARLTPTKPLKPNTTYTAKTLPYVNQTQTGLLTATCTASSPGCSFTSKTITFTTGTGGGETNAGFNVACTISQPGTTAVTFHKTGTTSELWWTGGEGTIYRQPVDPTSGACTGTKITNTAATGTLVTGMAFVPGDDCPYLTRNQLTYSNATNFTGRVSKLAGANCATITDRITGLPRSVSDHMTNQISYHAANNSLCFPQGAMSGYGGPDVNWGNRLETPLSAAILCFSNTLTGTTNVNTDTGYDPNAPGAPLTVFADGVRNAYDLVFHSNGNLYAAGNESASGNTPSCGANFPAPLTNLPAYNDYFTRITQGAYYGHPNPTRGNCTLNGGNPTAGADSFEVSEYPIGTPPQANYRAPDRNMGLHHSPDGSAENTTNACGGMFKGSIFIAKFADNAVDSYEINSDGTIGMMTRVISSSVGALDVSFDASGNLALASFGAQADGSGGSIKVYHPAC